LIILTEKKGKKKKLTIYKIELLIEIVIFLGEENKIENLNRKKGKNIIAHVHRKENSNLWRWNRKPPHTKFSPSFWERREY
jgi:hypothetical protein